MKVNGKIVKIDASQSITSLLLDMEYSLARVAVVLNGEIVSKEKFDFVMLSDDDIVEIISFVGGG